MIVFVLFCSNSAEIDSRARAFRSHHRGDRRDGIPEARSSWPSKTTNALPARPARSARANWFSFAPLSEVS